ncbi:molecular chaperone TorD family protein [Photobacterium makurazakiensis]|uniref:molecular chaperone TorD family protein n=1 Tax=Photobacterium makurazakiensis TaxID=2910234 RepID=UPI003D1112EF
MENLAFISRIIGALFFYSPASDEVQNIVKRSMYHLDSNDYEELQRVIGLFATTKTDELDGDYLSLFSGVGEMPAPPWGSVYLGQNRELFDESTMRYRSFLQSNNLHIETGHYEPDDHFGLMLLVVSQLLEEQNRASTKELLEKHLLIWAFHYLILVKENAKTDCYISLAELAITWCKTLQDELFVIPQERHIYFPTENTNNDRCNF